MNQENHYPLKNRLKFKNYQFPKSKTIKNLLTYSVFTLKSSPDSINIPCHVPHLPSKVFKTLLSLLHMCNLTTKIVPNITKPPSRKSLGRSPAGVVGRGRASPERGGRWTRTCHLQEYRRRRRARVPESSKGGWDSRGSGDYYDYHLHQYQTSEWNIS